MKKDGVGVSLFSSVRRVGLVGLIFLGEVFGDFGSGGDGIPGEEGEPGPQGRKRKGIVAFDEDPFFHAPYILSLLLRGFASLYTMMAELGHWT